MKGVWCWIVESDALGDIGRAETRGVYFQPGLMTQDYTANSMAGALLHRLASLAIVFIADSPGMRADDVVLIGWTGVLLSPCIPRFV